MCKIAYIVVCILLVYGFHVQCVGSSPSVIPNNSAIVNAKHMTKFILTKRKEPPTAAFETLLIGFAHIWGRGIPTNVIH